MRSCFSESFWMQFTWHDRVFLHPIVNVHVLYCIQLDFLLWMVSVCWLDGVSAYVVWMHMLHIMYEWCKTIQTSLVLWGDCVSVAEYSSWEWCSAVLCSSQSAADCRSATNKTRAICMWMLTSVLQCQCWLNISSVLHPFLWSQRKLEQDDAACCGEVKDLDKLEIVFLSILKNFLMEI